jgi:bacteriocin biosynthesis cyclodehydratase domain-containing protein
MTSAGSPEHDGTLLLVRPWMRTRVDAGRVLLEEDGRVVTLEGAAAQRVLPRLLTLLDGSRTRPDIVGCFPLAVAPAVQRLLEILEGESCLLEVPAEHAPQSGSGKASLFAVAMASPDADLSIAASRLDAARLVVLGASSTADRVTQELSSIGVRCIRPLGWDVPDGDSTFAIVAPRADELAHLVEWNEVSLRLGMSWIQALPFDGRQWTVGPLFVPFETCCYECYRVRRSLNLPYAEIDFSGSNVANPAPLDSVIAGLVASFAIRWIGTRERIFPGVVHSISLSRGFSCVQHDVIRLPRCPVCRPATTTTAFNPWFADRS